jgi:hypothetical protein
LNLSGNPGCVKLGHDFDDDLAFCSSVQNREDWRRATIKSDIGNAAAHRDDQSEIQRIRLILNPDCHGSLNSGIPSRVRKPLIRKKAVCLGNLAEH